LFISLKNPLSRKWLVIHRQQRQQPTTKQQAKALFGNPSFMDFGISRECQWHCLLLLLLPAIIKKVLQNEKKP